MVKVECFEGTLTKETLTIVSRMAYPISSGQNDGTDSIRRPRPIKPGNPMVLRAQSEEGSLKPSHGSEQLPSGISRYICDVFHLKNRTQITRTPVVAQPLFLPMPLLPFSPSLLLGSRYERSRSIEYSRLLNMPRESLTSIQKAIIGTSGDFSSCSGLGWRLWSSPQC